MRLVDLSLPVSDQLDGVAIRQARTIAEDGWNATTLEMYSHSGTHVDAPIHFDAGEQSIDTMPLEAFHAKCWLVDCMVGESELLTVTHLGSRAEQVGKGDGLILRTGWSSRIGQDSYRNGLPRISETLATWMVNRGIKLVGVEPPSVADVNNLEEVTKIHHILLGAQITIVEGLANLDQLGTAEQVMLMALPLKVVNGDGCPTRAVAIID